MWHIIYVIDLKLHCVDFNYLSFPELSPDFHSVEVSSWVGASVVVSYLNFLYDITDILQLGNNITVSTVFNPVPQAMMKSKSTHNEHVLSSPLKVQTSLSIVDTQVFLLRAHSLLSIQYYEHISVCSHTKHITGVNLDLIWHN